jgi:hypothetical protein
MVVNWLLMFGAIVGIALLGAIYSAQLSMAQPFAFPIDVPESWARVGNHWVQDLAYLWMGLTVIAGVVIGVLALFQDPPR